MLALRSENKQKQAMARDLYLAGWLQNEIAKRLGVSERTITSWKEKFSWDTLRKGQSITTAETLPRLEAALASVSAQLEAATANQMPVGALVDQVTKITNNISKLRQSSRFSDVLEVCKGITEFSIREHPDRAELVREVLDAFIHTKARAEHA